jgi:hypothetical protein
MYKFPLSTISLPLLIGLLQQVAKPTISNLKKQSIIPIIKSIATSSICRETVFSFLYLELFEISIYSFPSQSLVTQIRGLCLLSPSEAEPLDIGSQIRAWKPVKSYKVISLQTVLVWAFSPLKIKSTCINSDNSLD